MEKEKQMEFHQHRIMVEAERDREKLNSFELPSQPDREKMIILSSPSAHLLADSFNRFLSENPVLTKQKAHSIAYSLIVGKDWEKVFNEVWEYMCEYYK